MRFDDCTSIIQEYNRDIIKEFSIEGVDAPIKISDFEKEGFEIVSAGHLNDCNFCLLLLLQY